MSKWAALVLAGGIVACAEGLDPPPPQANVVSKPCVTDMECERQGAVAPTTGEEK